jgi:hypothetical protein
MGETGSSLPLMDITLPDNPMEPVADYERSYRSGHIQHRSVMRHQNAA